MPLLFSLLLSCIAYSKETRRAPSAEEHFAVDAVCEIKSASNLSNYNLIAAIRDTKSCSEIAENGGVSYFRPVAKRRLEVLSAEFFLRVKSSTSTLTSHKYFSTGIAEFRVVITEMRSRGLRNESLPSNWMLKEYADLGQLKSQYP